MSRLVNSEPREPVPVPKGGERISASLKTPGERMSRAPSAGEASANAADGAGRGAERKGRRPHVRPSLSLLFSGIADYITRCKQAIGKFESLVHQIHKNADDIASRLTLIESINLFKYPAPKSEEELPGGCDRSFF